MEAVKERIALVTGGSRGLGKNMALSIAAKGIDVVLTYHSKKEEALSVVTEIEQMGRKAAALQLNAGDVKSFDGFFQDLQAVLKDRFNTDRFDILVNNAGIGINKPFAETTEDQFDTLINIHYKGVFFLTQRSLPLLNNGGRIINISSGLARFCGPGYSAYGSAKSGVETLTRYIAKELGVRKITANVVAPGPAETDFGGGITRDNEQYKKMISGVTALGRAGVPEDIGGVVAFLCTPEAGWINGQRIEVSGGINL